MATTVCRILGFGSVAAVKAGLKCISHLMIVGEKGNWESVATVYGVLLGFVTDNRPKVKFQSFFSFYQKTCKFCFLLCSVVG